METPKNPDELNFNSDSSGNSAEIESKYVVSEQAKAEAKEALKGIRQDRKERKRYAKSIFRFIKIWAYSVIIIFVAAGKGYVKFDNSVIITLLSTTTANVLALFAIVANYLFYRNKG